MRNFKEFIDEKIAVSFVDENERDLFLKKCHENKLKCFYGCASYLKRFDASDAITMNFNGEHLLQHSSTEFYESKGYDIVPAAEFLTQSTPTIEIFQSKQTVVCLKKQDGKVVAVGKAKCNPEDAFDFKTGSDLAYSRMNSDEWKRNNPESQKMHELGKLVFEGLAKRLAAANSNIPFLNDAIKRAGEVESGRMKKEVTETLLNTKTLKNGMKIRKQDRYEVGDKVKFFKKIDGRKQLHSGEVGEVIETRGGHCKLKFNGGVDSYFYGSFRIKGKVIQ